VNEDNTDKNNNNDNQYQEEIFKRNIKEISNEEKLFDGKSKLNFI